MYSSRRRSSYRYRSYRYRKRMNNIYAPGNSNFDLPSYHQMKGRTIQASPRTLYNPPTSIPPPDEYDQMYKKLVKAGYGPVVNPPQPPSPEPIIPQYPQIVTLTNTIDNLFPFQADGKSEPFTSGDLLDALSTFEFPDLPSGYHYEAFLIGLNFDFSAGSDNSSWALNWYSDIFSASSINLANKTSNMNLTTDINNLELYVSPVNLTNVFNTNLTFYSNTINVSGSSHRVEVSLDPSQNRIPFISAEETDNNYLQLDRVATPAPKGDLSMYIQVKVVSDS